MANGQNVDRRSRSILEGSGDVKPERRGAKQPG